MSQDTQKHAIGTETMVAPVEAPTAIAPADLAVQSAAQVRGGPSGTSTSGGSTRLNHNESMRAELA